MVDWTFQTNSSCVQGPKSVTCHFSVYCTTTFELLNSDYWPKSEVSPWKISSLFSWAPVQPIKPPQPFVLLSIPFLRRSSRRQRILTVTQSEHVRRGGASQHPTPVRMIDFLRNVLRRSVGSGSTATTTASASHGPETGKDGAGFTILKIVRAKKKTVEMYVKTKFIAESKQTKTRKFKLVVRDERWVRFYLAVSWKVPSIRSWVFIWNWVEQTEWHAEPKVVQKNLSLSQICNNSSGVKKCSISPTTSTPLTTKSVQNISFNYSLDELP